MFEPCYIIAIVSRRYNKMTRSKQYRGVAQLG